MTISQPTPFLSDVLGAGRISEEKLNYFRARLKHRFHAYVLEEFLRQENSAGFTKADLARRLGKRPEQITRWLSTPSNWTLDTVSDLLLSMKYELRFYSQPLESGAVRPPQEDWKRPRELTQVAPSPGSVIWLGNMPPANEPQPNEPQPKIAPDDQQQRFEAQRTGSIGRR